MQGSMDGLNLIAMGKELCSCGLFCRYSGFVSYFICHSVIGTDEVETAS